MATLTAVVGQRAMIFFVCSRWHAQNDLTNVSRETLTLSENTNV